MADHVKPWAERFSDAFIRAWRTFYVSIGIDILTAFGTGLLLIVADADMLSATFWLAVLALLLRSTVTGLATYWVRKKFDRVDTPPLPTVE
jgi:uncharacterized membrane protein